MGKRKYHGHTYFQCDWTGLPMRNTNCYMPTWLKATGADAVGRLYKRGSYCNWESVVAHALHRRNVEKSMSDDEYARVREHVQQQCGVTLDNSAQLHYSFLEHFKDDPEAWQTVSDLPRNWSAQEYHARCCEVTDAITAVKINHTNDVCELMVKPSNGGLCFDGYLTRPYMLRDNEHALASFQSLRGCGKRRDRAIVVLYWPFKNGLPFNQTASNLFKMQIYGDALLVQRTNEASFMPRDRYLHFTRQAFDDTFARKQKHVAQNQPPALTLEEYSDLKTEMRTSLEEFERAVSSSAKAPQDLAQAATMPPPTGSELKEIARLLGCHPEKARRLEARLVNPRSPLDARSVEDGPVTVATPWG